MRHTGNGLDVPPTNRTVQITGMSVLRIAAGKFVAGWQNWDMLGLMQQIKDEPVAPTYIAARVGKAGVALASRKL
jgi:SnoaL-like polyketide cyclase